MILFCLMFFVFVLDGGIVCALCVFSCLFFFRFLCEWARTVFVCVFCGWVFLCTCVEQSVVVLWDTVYVGVPNRRTSNDRPFEETRKDVHDKTLADMIFV